MLERVARVSEAVAAEPGRTAKIALLAACLRELGPQDGPAAVALLSGESRRMRIGVGYAALREPPSPAGSASLGVTETEDLLAGIAAVRGRGAQAGRRHLLDELFGRATPAEQRLLQGVLVGELRQGALDGVMAEAVAKAAGVPAAAVRRALMFRGSARAVAQAALSGGAAALDAFGLEVGRPVRPMLASSAPGVAEALAKVSPRPWSGSWTASGCRCTGTATRSRCSPAASTTSPRGYPNSSRPHGRCRSARPSWTGRRSPSARTAAPGRSR